MNADGPARARRPLLPRASLLVFPLLLALATLVAGLIDANERTASFTFEKLFVAENWRYGLSFLETIFDPLVFWGEIWFSSFIAIAIAAAWLQHVPPGSDSWSISGRTTRTLFLVSTGVVAGVLVLMAILPFTGIVPSPGAFVDTIRDWWPAQAAYQAPVLPVIAAGLLLLLAPLGARAGRGRARGPGTAATLLALVALVPWCIAAIPAWWHPRGLFQFGYHFHLATTTIAFPACLAVLVLTCCLRDPPRLGDGRQHLKPGLVLLLASLGFLVLLQLIGAFATGSGAPGTMFDIEIHWWWPAAHAFTYLFTGSLVVAIVSGARLASARGIPATLARAASRWVARAATSRHPGPRARAIVVASCLLAMAIPPVLGFVLNDADPPRLLVNQVGYTPSGMKRVLFQAPVGHPVPAVASFSLVHTADGEVVHQGELARLEQRYQHWYMEGAFSSFNGTGTFHVEATIGGRLVRSPSFKIEDGVYEIALQRAVDFFYYQRCGGKVHDVVPGFKGHEACHLDDAMIFNGTTMVYKNLTGGWHDAGDYNKYNSWYYTQWRVTRALADAWADGNASFLAMPRTRDASLPDIVDEMLWGANYLVKCVDTEGIAPGTMGLVIHNVVDWNYRANKSALMSYSGPPHKNTDNIPSTGDERVVFTSGNPWGVPWGWAPAEAGFGFAGTLLRVARVMEASGFAVPAWSEPVARLRDVAALLDATYRPVADASEGTKLGGGPWPHMWTAMARLLYEQEVAWLTGNWTLADAWAQHLVNNIYDDFSGSGNVHFLGDVLRYYIECNRTVPPGVLSRLASWHADRFPVHLVGPFKVFHVLNGTGDPVLFSRDAMAGGGLINADHFWFAWFQALVHRVDPSSARPELVQHTLDYLFGMNPLGLCQMDGVGESFVPQIHHRYSSAWNIGGRVPGGIINAIRSYQPSDTWAALAGVNKTTAAILLPENAWVDSWPASGLFGDGVDAHSNEIWIIHDGVFLEMMTAYLKHVA